MGKDFVQLDPSLATSPAKPPAIPADATLLELHWLGGTDFAANVMTSNGEFQALILSSAGRDPLPLRSCASRAIDSIQPLRYEPSTHLLTQSYARRDGRALELRSSARSSIVASFPLAAASHDRELVPIAPALAGGKELVEVSLGAGANVTWTDATTKQRSAPMPITAFITADAGGARVCVDRRRGDEAARDLGARAREESSTRCRTRAR